MKKKILKSIQTTIIIILVIISHSSSIIVDFFQTDTILTSASLSEELPKQVYVCGNPVGFSLKAEGLIIIGNNSIITSNGINNPCENIDILAGDILVEIENTKLESIEDVSKIINLKENINKEITVKLIRKNNIIERKIKPAYCVQTKKYKLGLWVKDDATGVGTLTYITKEGRFGALGHAICDSNSKIPFNVKNGKMYKCEIIGFNKGERGKPGEIKGLFIQKKESDGYIDKNCDYGIYGKILNENLINEENLVEVGGRTTAKPGHAVMRTCIDGKNVKDYDIEIIKTNYQTGANDKSLVIKVVDKELLSKTGGIIQGMSGSPIIQNNKFIGAITHVYINDPTKGFGIYADWMLSQ